MRRLVILIVLCSILSAQATVWGAETGAPAEPASVQTEIVHPYFWHGVGFLSAAGLLLVNGIIFNALADKSWDKYRERADSAFIHSQLDGKNPDQYAAITADNVAQANSHMKDGKNYAATRTISYIAAGVFAATGTMLMIITEERIKNAPKIGAIITPERAVVSLEFKF